MLTDMTNTLNSPVRKISARVELFNGSAFVTSFTPQNAIKSFTVERVGDNTKFFGYGICQKMNLKLIDVNRELKITTADSFKNYLSAQGDFIKPFPTFKTTEVHRDENTNELSITAYDCIYGLTGHFVSELDLLPPYTIKGVVEAVCAFLGCSLITDIADGSFDLNYETGANIEGNETLREILDCAAEAVQAVYYIDSNENLVFKRLSRDAEAVYTIDRDNYITLDTSSGRRLGTIANITELGDNVSASTVATGTTQYIRNNPFWELREDIADIVELAILNNGGLTIDQFNCEWRGNFLLEPTDKIKLVTKDNEVITSFVLDEVIEYNGGLSSTLKWQYTDNENETESNPSTLGESLKQTFAKVDKANKKIDLVVSDVEELSSLQITSSTIIASVSDEVENLSQRVESSMTSEDVQIQINNTLAQGVTEVTTTTGFTFNESGLTVTKDGTEIKTQISENGMIVYRGREPMLSADNVGVKAENLHATTFLIIGKNSRLEDYDNDSRTGCFWIGN